MTSLAGQVAIVTGAGSGIGRAVTIRLAADGAVVVAADIAEDAAQQTAALAGDERVVALRTDVTSVADVDRLVSRALSAGGTLRVVVNNAGVLDAMAPVHEVDDAQWDRVIAVNLTGAFNVARAALAPMLDGEGGSIVNIASIGGFTGGRAGAAYTVSKHGVIGLTRSIAWMYADRNIRCNAVCPGAVATSIGESAHPRSDFGEGRLAGMLTTMTRVAEPEEIASVVRSLVGSEMAAVNGAIVTADGGWTAG